MKVPRGSNYKDLKGQRFGRLTCIEDVGRSKRGCALWRCRCDCGREAVVVSHSLISGNTKSCGCLASDAVIERNTKHSLSRKNGKTARLYGIWRRMKQRCLDENCSDYAKYGGRGINVCDEWAGDYKVFHDWAVSAGYDDTLTIERLDVNGGYNPQNCAWIPSADQARNKRNNHFIEYRGSRKTLAEWSEELGMESSLLRYRLKHWGVNRAFNTPVRRQA